MKRMMKRQILSILMLVRMVVGMLPTGIVTAWAEGDTAGAGYTGYSGWNWRM